jgi:hypothetical protein
MGQGANHNALCTMQVRRAFIFVVVWPGTPGTFIAA